MTLQRRAAYAAFLALAVGVVWPSGALSADWRVPDGDLAGTRDARDPALTLKAVPTLHRVWRFKLPEQPTYSGVIASTPLILGGTVFLQTLHSNVYALDAHTGRVEWTHRFDRVSGGPNGLSAGSGRLYGVTNTHAFALAPRTGRVIWSRRVTTATAPLDMAPAVADGLVVVGTSAQRPGGRGAVLGLAATTGRVVWRRSTIRGAWAHPRLASGGGVWWTPTVDSTGGLWLGTANPLPWGGTKALPNGGAYAGPAPYTDSLLSLTAADGNLRWADQVTPHDVRDYDFALPPILTRAGGRELVIGAGKQGLVIAWNRRTHRRVWSSLVGRHLHDTGPLPARPVEVCPGLLGGVLTPMAVAHGRVFVPGVNLCMRGSATGYEPLAGVDIDRRGSGQLTALDAMTGRKLWARSLRSPLFGCATAAGVAVFTTTYSGHVYALDQRTGRVLWSSREPAGSNACPAIGDGLLVVPAGAEPMTIATPTPVVDAYSISPSAER
jgi:outer membrane protein assembly factor BamB